MRPALGETPGRRITQRNLYSVLQCIDWTNPGESPMLKAASGSASGTAASGIPARYSTQYEKLVQWVYLVTQKPMPSDDGGAENFSFADLATGEMSAPRSRPATHISYSPASPGHDRDLKDIRSSADSKENSDAGGNEADGVATDHHGKPKTARGNSDSEHVPRRIMADKAAAQAIDIVDPYDPATFNNQANAPTEMPTPAARACMAADNRSRAGAATRAGNRG